MWQLGKREQIFSWGNMSKLNFKVYYNNCTQQWTKIYPWHSSSLANVNQSTWSITQWDKSQNDMGISIIHTSLPPKKIRERPLSILVKINLNSAKHDGMSMMIHDGTWKTEVGRFLWVQDQLGLHGKTLSQVYINSWRGGEVAQT